MGVTKPSGGDTTEEVEAADDDHSGRDGAAPADAGGPADSAAGSPAVAVTAAGAHAPGASDRSDGASDRSGDAAGGRAPGDAEGATGAGGDAGAGAGSHADGGLLADRTVRRLALALTLVPFVVGVLALLLAVGNEYHPWSDHALTELQTRSVGRHEVLVGLYSREQWNHPGPALFYVLAPFYWATGGMSVAISIGALAINGASVAGMALIARRLGGTPLMLVTLLANALLMRTLSAEFLMDPWNCFVTTLPFGLLVFLSWAMWRGEMWAFPVGAGVATFLAQSHVGFVVLAPPVLAWGVVGLVVSAVRDRSGERPSPDGGRPRPRERLLRAGLVGAVVLVVGWLPVLFDALRNQPANIGEIASYFRYTEDEAHTFADGWRVMSGQFGGMPEWLTYKHVPEFGGQSPFIEQAPLPWLLLLVAAAGVVLWRRRATGSLLLLATLGVTFAVGVLAVARTVGLAFDYRLRWTYVPGMVALVVVAWAAWALVTSRWPRAGARVLTPLALAGLAVLGGINVFTAATAGTPQNDDSAAVASLTDQVLDHLGDHEGTVYINDQMHAGAWHARGLLLQLERKGYDVGVHESLANEYGRHRVRPAPAEGGSDDIALFVSRDEYIPDIAARPGMRMIAEWYSRPEPEIEELLARHAEIRADMDAGRVSFEEGIDRQLAIAAELTNDQSSTAYHAAVFVDERSGTVAPPPG